MVVAPATANIIAKMANGIADDLISTTLLATPRPIVIAPAMNNGMWKRRRRRPTWPRCASAVSMWWDPAAATLPAVTWTRAA